MASEDNSYFTEDEFIFKKTQLSDLKTDLTFQLKKLIEDKEAFNSEILKLSRTITQSKDERIFLIQSLNHSSNTTFERRPTSDPIPFVPSDDEVSQQITDELSPNSKQLIRRSSKDEDYIEKRGRKPKTLRVSIPTSQIELPPEVINTMNKSRGKYKKSIKRHSLHSNNTHALPSMFSNNHSNSDNATTQIQCFPHVTTDLKHNNLPYNPPNTSDLVLILKSADSKHPISSADYAMYMQKGVERDFKEDSVAISENQSPNSKVGKSFAFSNRLEEENDILKAPPL